MRKQFLIISSEFPPGPGGIGQHAYSLAKALAERAFTIIVRTPADYATKVEVSNFDAQQPFDIKRYPRRANFYTYFDRLRMTFSVLRNNTVQAVILTGKFSLWQGFFIKLCYPSIKTLAVLHGSEVNLSNRLLRWFTHRSIAVADVIIPVSRFTRSLLPAWITAAHKNIYIIPNGIDQAPTSATKDPDIALIGAPRLLTVGHVSPRKGQHRVIKALPLLLQTWPALHYHVVGRPKNQPALEVLADELGVKDHITFHGRVPAHNDLSAYYQQADVFMLLSENQPDGDVEGFGIVALEANSYGVPVVGAKYCGVEEAVDHQRSGYLVDGDKPEEILEGVQYCLSNRERLQIGALEWVKAHQWSEIVGRYIECIAILRNSNSARQIF